jgi:hypothetical protein
LNNWGIALSDQAKTKSGEEADRLNALAEEKFEAARMDAEGDSKEALD